MARPTGSSYRESLQQPVAASEQGGSGGEEIRSVLITYLRGESVYCTAFSVASELVVCCGSETGIGAL